MKTKLTATTSVTIHAPASKVWEALVTPKIVKQYMFGADVESDWKVGSAIRYTGVYDGKPFEEKGEIKQFEPKKVFQATNFSSMSEQEDKPENYALVTYRLKADGSKTKLTISQNNIGSEKGVENSKTNWKGVLRSLKQTVEQ